MNRYGILALALALPIAGHAEDFTRTLQTGSTPDLYVVSQSGNIHVMPGSGSQIQVVGHVHKSNSWSFGFSGHSNPDGLIRDLVANPPIQQSGNSVHIGDDERLRHANGISIDYDITAPVNVALNLHTGSGDIAIDNLGRYVEANSGSGSVRAHAVHGESKLTTGSGDIELEQQAPGGNVLARSGSGSIRIHDFSGGLTARTGSGDIQAEGDLRGAGELRSGSGSIRLALQRGAHFNLEAETGSGSIRINYPNAPQPAGDDKHSFSTSVNGGGPELSVRTGSGDIEIDAR